MGPPSDDELRWSDHGTWEHRPEVAARIRRRHLLRWVAALTFVPAAVVFLASASRLNNKCRNECYGQPASGRYGSATYEAGHPWTSYADSWQWTAQHGLALLALAAALTGLGLAATSGRDPRPALALAVVAMGAWGGWVTLSPPYA